jgi:hypothetical protein
MFNKNILVKIGLCLASLIFSLALVESALRLLNKGVVISDPVLMRGLPPGGEIDV